MDKESDRRQLEAAIAEICNQIEETKRLSRLPDRNLDVVETRNHMAQAILDAMIKEVE